MSASSHRLRVLTSPSFWGVAAVAAVGAAIGWSLAPPASTQLGPVTMRVSTSFLAEHPAEISLPPVGEVGFDTHVGPVGIRSSVASVDPEAAQRLVEDPAEVDELRSSAPDALRRAVALAIVLSGVSSVVGAAAAVGIVYRSRRRCAQAGLLAMTPLVLGCVVAATTFNPVAFEQPRFTGLLERAPYLASQGGSVLDRLQSYRSGIADMVRGVAAVYVASEQLPVLDDAELTTVLHLSDIHLNPQGYDMADSLIRQFAVDAVVDTGDVTTWGTPAESATLRRIGALGVPYLFVRGNHDSAATAEAIQAQGAVVLDGGAVEVAGLRFAGVGSSRFTPDDDEDREKARAAAAEDAARLAELIGATNRSGDDVEVALIHDPNGLEPVLGTVPLVLSGHRHVRSEELDDSGTRVMVQGSTGGAGISAGALNRFEAGRPLPLEATLLYFATSGESAGRLVAWDDVTVAGLGLSSVSIDRTIVPADERGSALEAAVPGRGDGPATGGAAR